jgi:hypothetical protein
MKIELDPNLPNRTRTLAARFDHSNSRLIVIPAGLTLPGSGPPGERAREWPGVAPLAPTWGRPRPAPPNRPGGVQSRGHWRDLGPPSTPPITPRHPRCPPRNSSPKSSLDAPKDLGPHGNAPVVGCVGCFENNILDFECRK